MQFLALFSCGLFYAITFLYYTNKGKREFYEREGLNTFGERWYGWYQHLGERFSWSKILDPYQGLAPNYIKKILLVWVVLAILVQFIP